MVIVLETRQTKANQGKADDSLRLSVRGTDYSGYREEYHINDNFVIGVIKNIRALKDERFSVSGFMAEIVTRLPRRQVAAEAAARQIHERA
jgi:hypothetical protein